MNLQLDKSVEYGLVLEGGGAKGAYRIGAWKALVEAGIRIRGIAGASVGSLNGAMIAMGDVENACSMWENITYSKVMDIDDTLMEEVMEGAWKSVNLRELLGSAGKILKGGGFDVTPLKKLIEDAVDEKVIRESNTDLYIRTISLSDKKALVVNVKELPEGEIGDMLLASAYFPAFKRERLAGKLYLDGGMYDNVPVDILLDKGYENIIALRIHGIGIDQHTSIPENVKYYSVDPSGELTGVLEFDAEKCKRDMRMGYYDATRLIYGLKGVHYYIDAEYDEDECYHTLVGHLRKHYEKKGQEITLRKINEDVIPRIASKVCKGDKWSYEELYLRLLEHTAKVLGVPRFKVYEKDELLTAIKEAFVKMDGDAEKTKDIYVQLITYIGGSRAEAQA